jgi:hypothetical protein
VDGGWGLAAAGGFGAGGDDNVGRPGDNRHHYNCLRNCLKRKSCQLTS